MLIAAVNLAVATIFCLVLVPAMNRIDSMLKSDPASTEALSNLVDRCPGQVVANPEKLTYADVAKLLDLCSKEQRDVADLKARGAVLNALRSPG